MSKKAISVIGEGMTEMYYIESFLKLSEFTVMPKMLNNRASDLNSLRKYIDSAIEKGYDEVYCLIDMDGKRSGKNQIDYQKLKQKYQKIHTIKKRGISCNVIFIETERCTELWFLYHFLNSSITKEFVSYKELEKALQVYLPNYSKTEKYFRSVNLHQQLTTNNGSLIQAIKNSESSIVSRELERRDYTYSEIHLLIEALGIK